ncbi:MAG: hypothetical protein COU40_03940 [Candidatus Moranbacteria bacterium CG10_big_fil_rev_8_21_14_0_10_35_21]|nr:MAG: hypothetical protein COU40_03940 [Candidatus Moranbacteria bacterium CG10_big_fil_rev_8_21_14_0_10_35_21]
MDIFILASLLTAFVAGMAALFAPCCISVLLPSYLGSIFREKYKILLMTFVFFLGVLTVFLPIGLGFSGLSQFFREYHNKIFLVGGVFLTVLGIMLLTKKTFSLPIHVNPVLKNVNAGSVYMLGIFSGVATTCCAPVLAGAMALSVLPGSLFWGGVYTLMYVLGMVAPLFLIALFMDKTNLTQKFRVMRKTMSYNLAGKIIILTISELISGLIFLAMGIFTVYYAFAGKLAMHSDFQVSINIFFAKLLKAITSVLEPMAFYIWVAIFVALGIIAIKIGLRIINYIKNKKNE